MIATAAVIPTANAVTGSGRHGAAAISGRVNTVSRTMLTAVPTTNRSARGNGRIE
jgi:hypothetical protein